MKRIILLVSFLVVNPGFTATVRSQSNVVPETRSASGLTVEYGGGDFGITDENISPEKYSGSLPFFGVQWARDHTRNHFRLGLEVRDSDTIRNYNVSTNIMQFALYQAFLYPLSDTRLFGRDMILLVGPSTELYMLFNSQDIAVGALGFAESVAVLASIGVRAELVMPLSHRLQSEGSLRAGILSLGARTVDDERNDESPGSFLTVLSGTHIVFRLGVRCAISERWSCRLAYASEVTRIRPWQPLLSASDSLIFGLTWGL